MKLFIKDSDLEQRMKLRRKMGSGSLAEGISSTPNSAAAAIMTQEQRILQEEGSLLLVEL